MNGFMEQLDECRVKCITLDRFVDRYMPVRIQTQICDTLHKVLSASSKNRLQKYEIVTFRKLNNEILADQTQFKGEQK